MHRRLVKERDDGEVWLHAADSDGELEEDGKVRRSDIDGDRHAVEQWMQSWHR